MYCYTIHIYFSRPSRVATSPKETEDDLNNPISTAAPMTGVGWPVTGFKNRLDRGSGRRKSQQAEQATAVGGKSGGYVPEVEPTRGSGLRFHVPVRPPVRKTSNTDQPHIIQRQSTSVIHMTREAIVYSPASSTFSMTSVSSTRGKDLCTTLYLSLLQNEMTQLPASWVRYPKEILLHMVFFLYHNHHHHLYMYSSFSFRYTMFGYVFCIWKYHTKSRSLAASNSDAFCLSAIFASNLTPTPDLSGSSAHHYCHSKQKSVT